FHGRTFATMAATGLDKVRTGFGPMLEKFSYATYNDIESVKQLIDQNTAAIMLETIQGEVGVIPAKKDFIDKLVELAENYVVLIIIDQIQTGILRKYRCFGFVHYGLETNIFTVAKGFGNLIPVGAMIAKL